MRISRKQLWMGIAELAAKRSTCFRGNIGCAIVVNGCVVSVGYNGPPSGDDHCKGNGCETKQDGGCLRAVHAEDNALARIPKRVMGDFLIKGGRQGQLYVTAMPCPGCAAKIIDCNMIGDVYYQSTYRITQGIEDLINAGINVYRYSPSGYLVSEKTGEVLEAN
jgi:dCMP deaminase